VQAEESALEDVVAFHVKLIRSLRKTRARKSKSHAPSHQRLRWRGDPAAAGQPLRKASAAWMLGRLGRDWRF
jgi:hypothetical protein